MKSAPPKRRWFQFSLRTLLILTTVVAIGCGWFAMKIRRARRQDAAVEALRKACQANVFYDYQTPGSGNRGSDVPPGPAWFRSIFGEHVFADVETIYCSRPLRDAGAATFLENFDHL